MIHTVKSLEGVEDLGSGKYKFKNWIICLPCRHVRTEDWQRLIKFTNEFQLQKIINKIKEDDK